MSVRSDFLVIGAGVSGAAAAAELALAGSTTLIHLHGEMGKARCGHCEHVLPWAGDLSTTLACGACGRSGAMRPHVVWFGEMPFDLDRIAEALAPRL